jgi:glutamine synthetase
MPHCAPTNSPSSNLPVMDQPAVDPMIFSTILTSEPTKLLHDFLQAHPTVEYIQFQWQDLSGILRARNFTKQYGLELVASKRVRSGPPIAFHTTIDSSFLPRVEWAASNWYYPDWSSLKISQSKYATVMCGIVETTAAIPTPNLDLCPRRALVNTLQKAEAFQLNLLVGFEVEFMVLKTSPGGDFIPHSRGPGLFAVAGLRDACTSIVEECMQKLCESGVQIEGFHT